MKVLIVGLGSIARKHITALRSIDSKVEILALRSVNNAQEEPGVTNIYGFDQIPEDIDFAIISNPTSEHRGTIESLVRLNKPLFIEKPVLSSLEGARELEELIKNKGISTYIGCNVRFHPVIARLKEEVRHRKPLELNVYCGSYLPEWRPHTDYRKVYSAQKALGGGVHLDLIHELDYTLYLMGKPVAIQSYRARKSNLEINSVDIAHYTLEYDFGSAFITTNYYRTRPKRTIECVWNDEVWVADLITGTISSKEEGDILKGPHSMLDTYQAQMEYFLDSIRQGKKMMNDFSEALEVLEICLN